MFANKRLLYTYQRTILVSECLLSTGRRALHLPGKAESTPIGVKDERQFQWMLPSYKVWTALLRREDGT